MDGAGGRPFAVRLGGRRSSSPIAEIIRSRCVIGYRRSTQPRVFSVVCACETQPAFFAIRKSRISIGRRGFTIGPKKHAISMIAAFLAERRERAT
jgi:hypothetical protein